MNNQMKHHYTTLGLVDVVVVYEYTPPAVVYLDAIEAFSNVPSSVTLHEVYIDGLKCKGIKPFSYWQCAQWSTEIENLLKVKNETA